METTLKYCKIREVKSPTRGTSAAAGIDFYVPTDIDVDTFTTKCETTKCPLNYTLTDDYHLDEIYLKPGESVLIPSGIKMKVPDGHALVFFNKSGVASKRHLDVGASVVDFDYQGEVHIHLTNAGNDTEVIKAGDKIIQGIILPINFAAPEEISTVDELYSESTSDRGEGGFGSTGTR